MENKPNNILNDVSDYYTDKLAKHGDTPRGVDWNGEESQLLRFEQLLKVVDVPIKFSLNDLGCGYGALYDHLRNKSLDFQYMGCDISSAMIETAKSRHIQCTNAQFDISASPPEVADYSIASGIFNVRLNYNDKEWWEYLQETLDVLDSSCRKGFAFNCLTSYSDAEKMRDYLYYADPCALFDLCKRSYSRHVALFHDYGLYEFTIIVRKP